MASNSLLECLVFASSTSELINSKGTKISSDVDIPHWDESRVTEPDEEIVVAHNWDELRRFIVGLRWNCSYQQTLTAC